MLILHRSARADHLVDALGDVLAGPLDDPVVAEVVAVPTRGVERWIAQRLSHRLGAGFAGGDGVCANLDFPFPGSLITAATAAATGYDPGTDPWVPERAVWPLIDLVDEHRDDPRLGPLMAHLRASSPPDRDGSGLLRRFFVARHIADLFDRYAVHRPDLVLSWLAGSGPGADDPTGDGPAGWQGHLWRLLRDRLGRPGPAERLGRACAAIAADPDLLDLPPRLSVFGLTRLPDSHLEVLEAMAVGRDVHLFLLHPSGVLWDRVAASPVPARPARSEDPTRRAAAHPLLRSWGRDAREMQLVLAGRGVSGGTEYPVPEADRPTLLQRLQADIRADRPPVGAPRPELDPGDRSVQVHACHGRARQVEVLRDAVLHLLQSDPTLEPRDVIVMCPDIEEFAPLVQAAFGMEPTGPPEPPGATGVPGVPSGPPRLRVRLADRSLRQTNPLLGVAASLLDLAGSRVTASEVLDLASRPPVSRRFRFDLDDLSAIEGWVAESGIRWGLDAEHRRRWSLGSVDANTWSAGLDRLLLGVAMAERECRLFGDVLPFDDMPGGAVDLAGRFAEMVDRLGVALDRLAVPQTVAAWAAALTEATETLAVADADDGWQHDELRRTLAEAASSAVGGAGPLLGLDEARSLLAGRLQGRPTRANFRTGDLTVCTLVPMRSVPHRVVALLGLDDGAFPRNAQIDGDDLLLAEPRVGDRDARSEDRQLLLDALLAAGDHLVITYSGRDERTNRPRPPCAPVAELLDAIDDTACRPGGGPARAGVLAHHPLQPFDTRNFRAGAVAGDLAGDAPWSFDPVHLGGARAMTAQRRPEPWLTGPLPALEEPVVHLDNLLALLTHPARAFMRRRLSLYLGDRSRDIQDSMPVGLDALQRWGVGDRLLESVLSGVGLDAAERAERVRGMLPPGSAADEVLAGIRATVQELAATVDRLDLGPERAGSVEVRVELPGERTLIGTVPNVRGRWAVQCSYSTLAAKHRLAAWVRFLALLADRPDDIDGAVTVGRGRGRQPVQVARLAPPDLVADRSLWAVERLADLVALYDAGLRYPLPMPCDTAEAWASARAAGVSDDELVRRARDEWDGRLFGGERDHPEHTRLYGPRAPLSAVMAARPEPADGPAALAVEERTRFGVLARRLWDPLYGCERVGAP